MKVGLPLGKNVIRLLGKSVLILLGLTEAESTTEQLFLRKFMAL